MISLVVTKLKQNSIENSDGKKETLKWDKVLQDGKKTSEIKERNTVSELTLWDYVCRWRIERWKQSSFREVDMNERFLLCFIPIIWLNFSAHPFWYTWIVMNYIKLNGNVTFHYCSIFWFCIILILKNTENQIRIFYKYFISPLNSLQANPFSYSEYFYI